MVFRREKEKQQKTNVIRAWLTEYEMRNMTPPWKELLAGIQPIP